MDSMLNNYEEVIQLQVSCDLLVSKSQLTPNIPDSNVCDQTKQLFRNYAD